MDAKEFLMTVHDECKRHKSCDKCKFEMCCVLNFLPHDFAGRADAAIDLAEEVIRRNTYADDFFEKHPKASRRNVEGKTIPYVCKHLVYGHTAECGRKCEECWSEPIQEENE